MSFDELDKKLRRLEELDGACMPPKIPLVARIDGRGFTRLTKEVLALEAPFDERFRDAMSAALERLMKSGFRVIYGYTQSDEISLLFHPDDDTFERKLRKWNSVLAGEASAAFTHRIQAPGAFDCRVIPLPTEELVVEYFRWRQEDAVRNALNAHCYWAERRAGLNATAATEKVSGLSVAQKNELLFSHGINFNDLPAWQKRGTGAYWVQETREGRNPLTGETVPTLRRALRLDPDLPARAEYEEFIRARLCD
jgi:tRNA(His) guanylyltransferase